VTSPHASPTTGEAFILSSTGCKGQQTERRQRKAAAAGFEIKNRPLIETLTTASPSVVKISNQRAGWLAPPGSAAFVKNRTAFVIPATASPSVATIQIDCRLAQAGSATSRVGAGCKNRLQSRYAAAASPSAMKNRIHKPVGSLRLNVSPPFVPAGDRNRSCEKGRAGGRARHPARPLAGQSSETIVASGVASCKLFGALRPPLVLI